MGFGELKWNLITPVFCGRIKVGAIRTGHCWWTKRLRGQQQVFLTPSYDLGSVEDEYCCFTRLFEI